jgi:rhodanese-related sulfurtransferase
MDKHFQQPLIEPNKEKQIMKRLSIFSLVLVLILALAGITMAESVQTPTEPPAGVTIVSADEAKTLVTQKNVRVFDMRKALNFGKGHIPNAASLPYKWTSKGDPATRTGEFDMTKLPSDKETTVLFHSDGPNGWKSYYASKKAAEAGYKNVLWMREGFETWTEQGYPVEY